MPMKARTLVSKGLAISRSKRVLPSRQERSGRSWYQLRSWKQLRRQHLGENPHCAHCLRDGKPPWQSFGKVVDHIQPHKGDWEKFTDPANLQTLCATHHSRKTCREDGGFGRARKVKTEGN